MSSTDVYAQPAPSASRRNIPGLVALIASGVGVLLGLVQQVLPLFLWQTLGNSGYQTVAFVFTILLGVLALVAVGFGIAGLVIRNAARGAAAAGLALGVSTLLSILVSLVAGVVADAFY